ncbi:MAG: LysR family transcriptional regulator [Pseudomonas sp.]|nr:LysR family transcriptional regulator [Pseudomonas sp.]
MDTLEALRIFVSIDEAGSLSGAARQQSVATSTVSVALQQLEERAGVRLITRSTRRLNFTYEGRQFLADARRLLAGWDASLDGVKEGPLKGPIRLTATLDFGRDVVAPLIDRFMELHPGVQFELLLADGVLDLVHNDLDLALRNGPLTDSGLKARQLVSGRRVVCASAEYWSRHGTPKHPRDLMDHNCLVLARPGTSYSNWPFVVDGKRITVKVSGNRLANNADVLQQWAVKGFGVMIRTVWDVHEDLQAGVLITTLNEFLPDEAHLYAVTADGVSSRRVKAFIDFLAQALADMA